MQTQEVGKQSWVLWNHEKLRGVEASDVRKGQMGEAGQDQEGLCMPSYTLWVLSYDQRASTKVAGEQ